MGSILHCTDMHNLFCQFFRFGLDSPLSVKKNPPGFLLELFFVGGVGGLSSTVGGGGVGGLSSLWVVLEV